MSTIFCGPRAGREAFSPQDFSALSLWLDSAYGTTRIVGKVQVWLDRSGNGHDHLQLNAPNRPTFTAGGLNGFPTIDFDPTASNFMGSNLAIADCFDATKTISSVAMVIKTTSGVADNCIIGADPTNVFTSWIGVFLAYIDGFIYWDAGNATNGPAGARKFVAGNANAYSIFVFVRNGGTSTIYKNNSVQVTGAVATVFADGTPLVSLGCSTTAGVPGQFANMSISELCIWKSPLSANQVSILSREWGAKYGITVA